MRHILVSLVSILCGSITLAQQSTWIGGPGLWSQSFNWSVIGGPNPPSVGGSSAVLNFTNGPGTVFQNNGNYTLAQLNLSNGPYTLTNQSGERLIFTGASQINVTSGSHQMNYPGGAMRASTPLQFTISSGASLSISNSSLADQSIVVNGPGTLFLNDSQQYGGGTNLNNGTVVVTADAALGTGNAGLTFNGGTLRVTGSSFATTPRSVTLLNNGGTIDINGTSTPLNITQAITGTGGLTKVGPGTLVLSGVNTYGGITTINEGVLRIGSSSTLSPSTGVTLANTAGAMLDTNGFHISVGTITGGGGTGGAVNINGGSLTIIGSLNSTFSGAVTGTGSLSKTGAGTFILAGTHTYSGTTTITQGVLQFSTPLTSAGGIVRIENSGTLQANSTITRPVLGAGPGSTINVGASGITLGDSTSPLGFSHQGILNAGANHVTLASLIQPRLGSLTTLGSGGTPGTLSASNGVYLDFATAITGFGTISSPNVLAQRTIINGTVIGDSAANPITFSGWVKGVGSFNNVTFTGTFDPGLSPTLLTVGSLTFAATNTLVMELGGSVLGSQYDSIAGSGHLHFGGDLNINLINGYSPAVGQTFNLFDWVTSSGTFTNVNLPVLTPELAWDQSDLYFHGTLAIVAVPEPATIALLSIAVGLASTYLWRLRRRNSQQEQRNLEALSEEHLNI